MFSRSPVLCINDSTDRQTEILLTASLADGQSSDFKKASLKTELTKCPKSERNSL